MDSCASKLDSGAISSPGAIGSLELAPMESITGPIAATGDKCLGIWRFSYFTLLLMNNFLFIDTRDEMS